MWPQITFDLDLWPLTAWTYEVSISINQVWYKIEWIEYDTQRYWSSYEFLQKIVRGECRAQFFKTHSETNIFDLCIMRKNRSVLSLLLCYENLTEITVENLYLPYPELYNTRNHKQEMRYFEAQKHWELQKDDGNHPKYLFRAENTLEPNNTNLVFVNPPHEKWREPPKIMILRDTLEPNNTGNHKSEGNHLTCWILSENMLEPNNKGNNIKWRELPKLLILSKKVLWSQTTMGTITSEGNHPKCRFWAGSTLELNNTGNHYRWKEPPKILILSRKQYGAKQHWEPNKWRGPPK